MLEVKERLTAIDRLKQAIGLGTATNGMIIEFKELQLEQLTRLRQFAASDVWVGIDKDIEAGIDEQKELIVQLAFDVTESAKVQRIYHTAVIDALRILKNAVVGDLLNYQDVVQELKLRNKMQNRSEQETATSSKRLLSIFGRSNNNG